MSDTKIRETSSSGIGQRLKLRRLAKGWSLDDLATEMGGLVTKQAIHKYEKEQMRPSPRILQKLAHVLTVSAAHLTQQPDTAVTFVAYRKTSGLGVRDQEQMEARVEVETLERVRLQKLLGQELNLPRLPVVKTLDDAERAAEQLRSQWKLGVDAICSLSSVLEDHGIHIIEVDAPEKFDGLSAHVHSAKSRAGTTADETVTAETTTDFKGECVAAAVVVKRDLPGDRWRLTTAHELGHLVLRFLPAVEEAWIEKAAFRFASAFLAPRPLVEREVGAKRHRISPQELFLLKPRFGMSAQAIVYRLRELDILSVKESGALFDLFTASGWKKTEPHSLEKERPTGLKRNVYRALSEGLISRRDATHLLDTDFEESASPVPTTAARRLHGLLRLPLEERRRILEAQSQAAGDVFSNDSQWKEWEAFSDPVEWSSDLEAPSLEASALEVSVAETDEQFNETQPSASTTSPAKENA